MLQSKRGVFQIVANRAEWDLHTPLVVWAKSEASSAGGTEEAPRKATQAFRNNREMWVQYESLDIWQCFTVSEKEGKYWNDYFLENSDKKWGYDEREQHEAKLGYSSLYVCV